jgi:acyl-CoA thioesterase-2
MASVAAHAAHATTSVADLLRAFELDELGPDHFRADCVAMNLPHLFGGQVLAQSLIAAARSVPAGKSAHSLHAYFLRAGDPREPIEFVVDQVRDGRRLSCRSVSARQRGKPIASVMTSFAAALGSDAADSSAPKASGVRHQIPAPAAPGPYDVPSLHEAAEAWGGLGPGWRGFEAIELRLDPRLVTPNGQPRAEDSAEFIWQRSAETLPDDPLLHQAVLVYMSDIMLLAAALVPHGVAIGQENLGSRPWDGVSLDHAIWFHQPVLADQWLLFSQRSNVAGSGRAHNSAEIFSEHGQLIASTAQEGLLFDPT